MSATQEFRWVATAATGSSGTGDDKAAVLQYLHDGRPLTAARTYGSDERDPSRRRAFPLVTYTDGYWVWPASVAYYLREYDTWPEPDFVRGVAAAQGKVPEVSDQVARAALEFLQAG